MTAFSQWLHHRFYCSDITFCFHCRISDQKDTLVSLVIGSVFILGGTGTPFDIKKSIMSGVKLLKKLAAISNGNTTSCVSESI